MHRGIAQDEKSRKNLYFGTVRFDHKLRKIIVMGTLSMETQTFQNKRRSERVLLRMSVMVLAENEEHRQMQEEAKTQVVNAHGGLMIMKAHLHMGQSFLLKNPQTGYEMSCRVVRVDEAGTDDYNIAFEFDRPAPKFWPVTFPPTDWGLPS